MNKKLSAAEMKYIIYKIVKNGYESSKKEKNEPTDLNKGRSLAYWEILDTIYNRLEICEQNTSNFGYPDDWERKYWAN